MMEISDLDTLEVEGMVRAKVAYSSLSDTTESLHCWNEEYRNQTFN